jgi:hypothetical protein
MNANGLLIFFGFIEREIAMTFEEFKARVVARCKSLGIPEAHFRIDERGRYWAYTRNRVLFGNPKNKCIGERPTKRGYAGFMFDYPRFS